MSNLLHTTDIEREIEELRELNDDALASIDEERELANLLELKEAAIRAFGEGEWYDGYNLDPDGLDLTEDPEEEPLHEEYGARDIDGTTEWED